MDYALIGKIEKAKMYAAEPERIQFDNFSVRLSGDNESVHDVGFKEGNWQCDCQFFNTRGFCRPYDGDGASSGRYDRPRSTSGDSLT